MCFCQLAIGQSTEASTKYLTKVASAKMQFYLLEGEVESNTNKRSDKCDFKQEFKPDMVLSLKKGIEIWYQITLPDPKMPTIPKDMLSMMYATNITKAAIEDEDNQELPVDSQIKNTIKAMQTADWAEISTFVLNPDLNKCLRKDYCSYLMMYKAGSGYASILIFYSKEEQYEVEQNLRGILSSLHF